MRPLLPTTRSADFLTTVTTAVRDFLATDEPAAEGTTPHVEPFCGAAEIPFGLGITNCILNDENPHIINFYEHVKSGEFFRRGWLISEKTDQRTWSKNRNQFNELIDAGNIKTVKAAQLTFYLHHVGRNFKFDQSQKLISLYNLSARLPEVDWHAAAELMQNWELQNKDYSELVVPENAPIVVDAPLIHSPQWDTTIWGVEEHTALRDWLDRHENNRVLVFHQKRSRPEVDDLYAHWTGEDRVFHAVLR